MQCALIGLAVLLRNTMDLHAELIEARKRVADLEDQIDRQEQQKVIELLTKNKDRAETFISKAGTTWYKFPAQPYNKTVGFGTYYFLTDLNGNYISDTLYYEGRRCAPAWAVGACHCATELQAINCFEGYNG